MVYALTIRKIVGSFNLGKSKAPRAMNLMKSKEKESARKSIYKLVKSHLSTASISTKDVFFPFLSVLFSMSTIYIGKKAQHQQ